MKPRRLLLSISIVSVAITAASAVNLFEEIGEELFDDVLRPILDIFPGSPPHPDYAGQGPYSMGRVDLLIQNWFHRKSKGRQCKGRWPRNFDFFS